MTYLIALPGATIGVLNLMGFVRAYDRRLKNFPGLRIVNEGRSND
ncbi:hypothetical protein WI604_25810 [Bradyrhizobium symbiodeficiens]